MNPSEMADQDLVQAVWDEVLGLKNVHVLTGQNMVLWRGEFKPLHRPDHWWMVVERMRELGFDFGLVFFTDKEVTASFTKAVNFAGIRGIEKPIGRAVLEAALAAVRGKEEG